MHNSTLEDTGATVSVLSQKFFNSLPQNPKLLKLNACTVTSANDTDLGPIGQCYLPFRLGNKNFMDKFIILQDLHRVLILGLNRQFKYKIGCNWSSNGQHYMTHNNDYLCTSIPVDITKPIIQNVGGLLATQVGVNHLRSSAHSIKVSANLQA